MNFNGAYNCSGDNEVLQCTLSCPSGVEIDGQLAPVYKCNYANGFFEPTPIPVCKYSEFSDLRQELELNLTSAIPFQVPTWK